MNFVFEIIFRFLKSAKKLDWDHIQIYEFEWWQYSAWFTRIDWYLWYQRWHSCIYDAICYICASLFTQGILLTPRLTPDTGVLLSCFVAIWHVWSLLLQGLWCETVYILKQDHLGKLCKCIRNLSTEKKYQLQMTGSCDACWTSLGFSYVFLKLHNIQSDDTKRVIAGRYIIYYNILKRARVSSKSAMTTRSWHHDFQLKIARVHQRKYLCKAVLSQFFNPFSLQPGFCSPFTWGLSKQSGQWRYMPFSRETPDMIQHQSRSHPTIIAEIIQMNSVLKFFCRDWGNEWVILHARCLLPSVNPYANVNAGEASHGSSWWNSIHPDGMALSSNNMDQRHNPMIYPVIRRFSGFFFRHPKNPQVLNRHGNVLRTPVPGIPNPSWGVHHVHPHRHSHLWCQLVTFPCWKFIFCWILETSAKSMSLLHAATFQLRHGGQMRQWKLLRGWSFFSNS